MRRPRQRLLHRPAQQPHHEVERGKQTLHFPPACGPLQWHVFRRARQFDRLRHEKNELWSIAPDGKASLLWKDYEGKRLNGPNDVWIHPGGGLYLTDPFYKRPWWQHDKMPQNGEHVYYLATDHRKLIRVTGDLTQPNGITGTPDGKTLYVADLGAKKTFRYDIQPDGKLTAKKLFCEQGSDGMTIDNENNLYLTGKGVMVFGPTGKQIEHIQVPDEPWTANVCFGGKDDKHSL